MGTTLTYPTTHDALSLWEALGQTVAGQWGAQLSVPLEGLLVPSSQIGGLKSAPPTMGLQSWWEARALRGCKGTVNLGRGLATLRQG